MRISKEPLPFFYAFCCLILISLFGCQTGNRNTGSNPGMPPEEDLQIDPAGWETYENTDFNVAMEIPGNWTVVETPDAAGDRFIANILPADRRTNAGLPLNVHGDANLSYLSIMPAGLGTEYPSGRSTTFAEFNGQLPDLMFPVDEQASKVFQLENGSAWAYAIRPESVPLSWSDAGFIFAQIAVNDFRARCYDKVSGAKQALEDCDPLEGDRFVREGSVDANGSQIINSILSQFSLENTKGERNRQPIRELIRVEAPLPNLDIRSPYTVKGEAVGQWYFEGSFPVRLYDADEQLLAEGVAEAQGPWMTEDFVPFEVTLTFNAPDDERGEMVFQRANPSGLPENERRYSLPVIFPPEE